MTCKPTVREVCTFLSDYSVSLFGSGSTCIRLKKNVTRIAVSLGMKVELTILPRHIHLTVTDDKGEHAFTSISSIRDYPVSFNVITLLSKLSWKMADKEIGFDDARKEFAAIMQSPTLGDWSVLLLVSLANASFCRLFGGDFIAMGIVFLATLAGYLVKQTLLSRHVDFRLTVLACSFVSSVLASADYLFALGTTPSLTIGTCALYLVPGIPFINSFCDMIDRHYICAFGRLSNAVVISCCLSMGLYCGMWLMNVDMFQ